MLEVIGKQAKDASRKLAVLGSVRKNEGLRAAAEALLEGEELILAANLKDIRKADQTVRNPGMIDRLTPVSYSHLLPALSPGILLIALQPQRLIRLFVSMRSKHWHPLSGLWPIWAC